MAQTDVRTGITGYKVNISGTYVEVRDYCPLFLNCTQQSSSFKNSNGTAVLKGIEKYSSDTWVKSNDLPYFESGSRLNWCVRGTKPQFNVLTLRDYPTESGKPIKIYRTNEFLTFENLPGQNQSIQLGASNFKDRVVPLRLLVAIQGGGGGGGSSGNVWSGAGGGGGGYLQVILNLEKTGGYFTVIVGAGGRGGNIPDIPAGGNAESGQQTSINWYNTSTSVTTELAAALGGYRGESMNGVGGPGGGYSINTTMLGQGYFYYVSTHYTKSGAAGGTGGNGGGEVAGYSYFATNNPDEQSGINIHNESNHYGGETNGATTGGGGGASPLGEGGYEGGVAQDGFPGTYGSGGGGGRFTVGAIKNGGDGGDGVVTFYY